MEAVEEIAPVGPGFSVCRENCHLCTNTAHFEDSLDRPDKLNMFSEASQTPEGVSFRDSSSGSGSSDRLARWLERTL